MKSPTLHDLYFDYLIPQIRPEDDGETYIDLLRLMHEKEFVWFVPNDDNRIMDGLDIRTEWILHVLEAVGPPVDLGIPCSFLEVLIGISRRMGFITSEEPSGWAWQLILNLELNRMRDPLSRYKKAKTDEILERVIWRTYERDGAGGFFPLTRPRHDQRKIEIWAQMNAYIIEIHPDF